MHSLCTHTTAPPSPLLFISIASLHIILFAQYFVHPQPTYLIARVVHRSSSAPLRRTLSSPPHRPSSSTPSSPLQFTTSTPHLQPTLAALPHPFPASALSPHILPSKSSPPPAQSRSSSPAWLSLRSPSPSPTSAASPGLLATTSLTSVQISSSSTTYSKPSDTYRNSTSPVWRGNDSEIRPLSSQLITLHEPFGQYFAVMELGSPPSEIAVIIDTGSELTWVQCEPCLQCGVQIRDPIFDPSKSHSYHKLQCKSNWCRDTTGLAIGCRKAVTLSPGEKKYASVAECFYNATYGDSSVSYGELSSDTLTVPSVSGAPVAMSRFVFGCGRENTGVETDFKASGLMGLDRGSHSIISQLGVSKFAYCLPDRSHNIDASGFIIFGNYNNLSELAQAKQQGQTITAQDAYTPPPMQYMKLLLNNKSDFYAQSYYVNLTGIRVGGQQLDIPASLFEIDRTTGYGGTIIDTGTSLTSFMDAAYTVFQGAMRSQVSGDARLIYIPELPGFDSCYTVGRGEEAWPQISLQFDGGAAEMQLPEGNVWLQVGTEGERNLYCLAFAAAGEGAGGRNVIGNFQQQNFLVEYDVGGARIGFAHLQRCSSGQERQRVASLYFLIVSCVVFFLSSS